MGKWMRAAPATRRGFLRWAAGSLCAGTLGFGSAGCAGGPRRNHGRGDPASLTASAEAPVPPSPHRFEPEYARALEEVLIVYDQVAADYLFQEVSDLLGCLPPHAKVHFLASLGKEEEARGRLEAHGIRANLLVCDCQELWGDWGRDIFQVGWRDGERVLFVPYTKTASTRGDLTRGYEVLRTLCGPDTQVKLVPLSFEGGNMAYDRVGGRRALFVGNSVITDSMDLYKRWFGSQLSPRDVIALLKKSFGVDLLIPLGRTEQGMPLRQASAFFHIDLACAILAEGVVAIERFEPPSRAEDLRDEIEEEIRLAIMEPADLGAAVEAAAQAELRRLREGHEELSAVRGAFRDLGYRIHDLPTGWQRVRRSQSYANVLIGCDRLILPIFPPPQAGKARTVLKPEGRQIVEILRHPRPSEYAMDGWNRENYKVYRSLFENVRVVRDSFYLAGGSIHCVVGAMG